MLAFMVFLIYNSVLAIAVLPKPYSLLKINSSNYTTENKSNENPSTLNIYMHVFVANYEEFNSNDYLPYIQTIAKKYTNFKYKIFIVVNDSTEDTTNDNISDKQINELALNSLWTDNEIISKRKLYENLTVKNTSLSEYMDTSPLKKYWRFLPHQFIGFFARCIAVWDKGGLAINPSILTPKSPNSVYLDKLHSILENFQSKHKLMSIQKRKISKISKKKLNNIRDIINDLEKDDNEYNIFTDSLAVAENIPAIATTSLKTKRNANFISFDQHYSPQLIEKHKEEVWHENNSHKENTKKSGSSITPVKIINGTKTSSVEAAQKILPNFLEFLFQSNSKNLTSTSQNLKNFTRDFKSSDNPHLNDSLNNVMTSNIDPAVNESSVKIKTKSTNKTSSGNERTKLIIDLKGNLIATEIACHAFIGTVLGNILHSTDYESLTDFITNELSLFCKGNLSTCNNVEVILV